MRTPGKCLAFNQHLLCVSTTLKGEAGKEPTEQDKSIPEIKRKPGNCPVAKVYTLHLPKHCFSCTLKTKMASMMAARSVAETLWGVRWAGNEESPVVLYSEHAD